MRNDDVDTETLKSTFSSRAQSLQGKNVSYLTATEE